MDTKTVCKLGNDGSFAGLCTLDKTDKSPSGAWNIPANCVDVAPPVFDAEKQTCKWQGDWIVAEIPQPTLTPEPTEKEIKQRKYSAINADYSQKIAAVCTSGITTTKQDSLIVDLRTKWKAAIISVSSS